LIERPARWLIFLAAGVPLALCGASYQVWQLAERAIPWVTEDQQVVVWKQNQTLVWDLTVVDDLVHDLPYGTPCTLEAEVSRELTMRANVFGTELRLACEDTLIFDTRQLPRSAENSVDCSLTQYPLRTQNIYQYEIGCSRSVNDSIADDLGIDMPRDAEHLRIGTAAQAVVFLAAHEKRSRPALGPPVLEPASKSPLFQPVAIEATVTKSLKGVPLDEGEKCLVQVDDTWSGPGCWVRLVCDADHDPTYDEGECTLVDGTLRQVRLQTAARDAISLELDLDEGTGSLVAEGKRIPLALAAPEVLDACPPGFIQIRGHKDGLDTCLLFQIPLPHTPTLRGECGQLSEDGWLGFSWEPVSDTPPYRCPSGGQSMAYGERRLCRWDVPVLPDEFVELGCDNVQEHLGYSWEREP